MKRLAPAVLAALAGAILLIVQWAGNRPLWADEQMIAINIRDRAPGDLAGRLWLGQSAPLGWLALQRPMLLIPGSPDQAMRVVPVLFGLLTLIAAAWTARRWMTALGGLVFTLLCAFGVWIAFYPLELKHYSADAFFGLLLPIAAAWALEGRDARAVRRRAIWWWIVAAAAHWLSNGGLFAAPGCALVLVAFIWRRHGLREAAIFAAAGLAWLASFAIYYQLSLTHTHHNSYLRNFWILEMAPRGAGLKDIALWIGGRFKPLAMSPGGTSVWIALWVCALGGFAFARHRALAALFAMLPLTAFVLALAGLVPLWERFALWIVPALYAGIAMLADRAVLLIRDAGGLRLIPRLARAAAAFVMALSVGAIAVDVVARRAKELRYTAEPMTTNHGLNDRDAAAWLFAQRKPGDAILTTRLGWPALWWYGPMRPQRADDVRPDMLEVGHRFPGRDCHPEQLEDQLRPFKRALVHVGFPDMPRGFGGLLMRHLDQIGAIAQYRQWGHDGFTVVVELHTPNPKESTMDLLPPLPEGTAYVPGCVSVSPVQLW